MYYYGTGSGTEDPVKLYHAERALQRSSGTDLIVQGAVSPVDGAWQAPVHLSARGVPAPGLVARLQAPQLRTMARSRPSVALDALGNAVAVWPRSNATGTIVQGAVRPAGGSWQAAVDISVAGQDASDPQVAVDPQGNAVAIWLGYNGVDLIVQVAVRPEGGSWQAPVDLSAAGQNAFRPRVAVGPKGDAVAVWRCSYGTKRSDRVNTIVQSTVCPAGGSWQPPVDLFAPGRQRHPTQLFDSSPSVGVDSRGDAVAVWAHAHKGGSVVQGAACLAAGGWTVPVDISDLRSYPSDPQVVVDPRGDAVAVWATAGFTVQGAARPSGGGWQAPVNISPAGQHASAPRVAVDPQGNAIAVWRRSNRMGTIRVPVVAARRAGEAWQAPADLCVATAAWRERRGIERRTGPNTVYPYVAVGPGGHAVAVWALPTSTHLMARAAERPAGGVWQTPIDLSVAGQDGFDPDVAVDLQGNATAVWFSSG